MPPLDISGLKSLAGDKPGVIEEGLKEVHRRGRRRDPDDDELAVAKQLLRNRVSRE